mmetsp:Transcript_13538/g.29701  ORF Transcript_13538/g.29701 Transcript_13538/m.29701 type:complete len:275 (-) Transcript_13538:1235-2059(-)
MRTCLYTSMCLYLVLHRHGLQGLGGGRSLVLRLHGGEQQHLLDVGLVCQEHRHAVHAQTPAASGGEAVLHGDTEVLVVHLCLVVPLRPLRRLLLEPLPLHHGVVQLRVGVANLPLAHKQLEALSEPRARPVGLGERRHHLGVVGDERGVDAVLLQEVAHQLVHQTCHGAGGAAVDVVLRGHYYPLPRVYALNCTSSPTSDSATSQKRSFSCASRALASLCCATTPLKRNLALSYRTLAFSNTSLAAQSFSNILANSARLVMDPYRPYLLFQSSA